MLDEFNPDVYAAVSKAAAEISKEIGGIDHFGRLFFVSRLKVTN